MDCNIYENPARYIDEITNMIHMPDDLVESMKSDHEGKSIMCAWITKLCPLECANCFFRSNMNRDGLIEEEYVFTSEGLDKFIAFVNVSNNGYLMLSGGGDPMVYPEKVKEIVRRAATDRIVLVTSGFWAADSRSAEKAIDGLHDAWVNRPVDSPCVFVLRLSVDDFHSAALGSDEPFKHIIDVFHRKYADCAGFELMLHTIRDDSCVERVTDAMHANYALGVRGESDNETVIKIVPQKARISFDDGYEINVGVSKLFMSNLSVDLRDKRADAVKAAVRVMTDDMENSEQDNPGYVQNASGQKGFDFWVDYNGNVTVWFDQDWNRLFNLYTDTYEDVITGTLTNPLAARFLKKGFEYRNAIVSEVNPLAVLRSTSINLRDYTAGFLLEENKTKLHYAIRAVQGFMEEYWLEEEDLDALSPELRNVVINCGPDELKRAYDAADYDMLDQCLIDDDFDLLRWADVLHLIALGHYAVNKEKLREKMAYFDARSGMSHEKLEDFILPDTYALNDRLHKRVSFMKPETLAMLKSRR